jgi:hypothetical protein
VTPGLVDRLGEVVVADLVDRIRIVRPNFRTSEGMAGLTQWVWIPSRPTDLIRVAGPVEVTEPFADPLGNGHLGARIDQCQR